MERTYWAAWERSCAVAEVRTAKVTRPPDAIGADGTVTPGTTRTETSKREVVQCGNPAFLRGVERCIEKRCKLLGLIVDKIAGTTPDGKDTSPTLEAMVAALIKGEAAHATAGAAATP